MKKYCNLGLFNRTRVILRNSKRFYAHTKHWEFVDGDSVSQKISHYTISRRPEDDEKSIISTIRKTISSNPESLVFITQKSKLTRRLEENPNYYVPLTEEELHDHTLIVEWIRKRWLRPDGGHTCMALTDENGYILANSDVSIRPSGKRVISGRSTLHPTLYPEGVSFVHEAIHTTIYDEIDNLAKKMMVGGDSKITADITIIPIANTKDELDIILNNIKSARAIKLYNLCSLIVDNADIEKINDNQVKSYVKRLQSLSSSIPGLQDILTGENESILAALACTHAVVKACVGDTHQADKTIFPDQDTQTIVVYCTMALTGASKFSKFAKEINFLDSASEHTKSSVKLT